MDHNPAMANAPRRRNIRSLVQDTGGAVYVEFLVAFIPFFVMVLGMMQIALMYSAHLVVQHAAVSAARASIVVFPDCSARYDGAPENNVNGGGRGQDPASALGQVFGAGSVPSIGGLGGGGSGSRGGARLDAVRFAAGFPLLAAAPSSDELLNDGNPRRASLVDAIGGTNSPVLRLALGALAYNSVAMAVTYPQSSSSSQSYTSRFSSRQPITARVTYLFHCGVPIVSAMACDNGLQLRSNTPLRQLERSTRAAGSGRLTPGELNTAVSEVQAAQARLQAAQAGLNDIDEAGLNSNLLFLGGGNYSVIRAEATLPNQGSESARIGRPCYNVSN